MMTKNEIIENLRKLVNQNTNNQGVDLYKSTISRIEKGISNTDAKTLYHNYCGYLARGEFTRSEYDIILEIIDFFKKYE